MDATRECASEICTMGEPAGSLFVTLFTSAGAIQLILRAAGFVTNDGFTKACHLLSRPPRVAAPTVSA